MSISSSPICGAPDIPKLCIDQIHIWIGETTPWEQLIDSASFSLEELGRSRQFRSEQDQPRALARRLCARTLAAKYLNCDPADLAIAHEPSGKPYLLQNGRTNLQLSMSRTGTRLAIAFRWNNPIGIDIEPIPAQLDSPLLSRVLTPSELADVLPNHTDRFAAYWTRKEAYLKATGIGLRIEPATLNLPTLPTHWQGARTSTLNNLPLASWILNDSYAVSLCTAGPPCRTWFGSTDTVL